MKKVPVLTFLVLLWLGITPFPTHASTLHCFSETGFCIADPLYSYWLHHGGLAMFGFPVSAEHVEPVETTTLTVQWFERDRLEIQPDGTITTGRLGARLLEYMHTPWTSGDGRPVAYPESMAPIPPPLAPEILTTDCTVFSITGHPSCGLFAAYWRDHGGLERFGYPITPVYQSQLEDGTWHWVQYYERRRLEYHQEYAGTPYTVLLGLLGTQLANPLMPPCTYGMNPAFQRAYQAVAQTHYIGCPLPTDAGPTYDLPGAVQTFEHGTMLWVDYPSTTAVPAAVYVILDAPQPTISHFFDTWHDGDPNFPLPSSHAWRGFGNILRDNPELASQLGSAHEFAASETRIDVLRFSAGWTMLHSNTLKRVYVFKEPDPTADVFLIDTPYP